jgi:sugar phosphate isomerase/epimerase
MYLCLSGFLFERAYRVCDLTFPDFVALAEHHGFDGLELRRTQISAATSLEQVRTMRRVVEDHGLFVNCMESRGMPETEPQRSEFIKALLDRAAVMGARMIKIAVPSPDDLAWFRHAADSAQQSGIRLGTNNHVGSPSETVDGTLAALRGVQHENFGVLFDCLHLWVCGEDYIGAVRTLAPHLLNVLVHAVRPARGGDTVDVERGRRRFTATTVDDPESQDWRALFAMLHAVGFEGPVTVIEHTEDQALRSRIVETYPQLIRQWWEESE